MFFAQGTGSREPTQAVLTAVISPLTPWFIAVLLKIGTAKKGASVLPPPKRSIW
jgi:hypothetical protein